jgi:hypothetical protein
MNRRNVILALVIAAVLVSTGLAIWWSAYHRNTRNKDLGDRPADLISLADIGSFPADYREAAAAVREVVDRSGEQSNEFFVKIGANRPDKIVVLHLWHQSAWAPENKGKVGNPGGKCRDAWFDPALGQVVRVELWQ